MKIIVTTITRSPRGNPMRSSREIQAEQVRIGRGAECELRLPDPRVPLHARSIFLGKHGPQLFDAADHGVEASITGVHRPQALTPGSSLRIGPYRLEVVAPHHDTDLALTVELVQPLPEKTGLNADALYQQARRLPLSKRALSWSLGLGILLLFLLLPGFEGVVRSTPALAATPGARLLAEASQATQPSWNPGPLAAGHQPFAHDCRACHSESFTRVQDRDCQACHQSLGTHAATAAAQASGLAEVRCASCHRDHKGATALRDQATHFAMQDCARCHAALPARLPATALQPVSDFARAHPDFRVQFLSRLAATPASPATVRPRLPALDGHVEQRGLKFPHDLHLDPRGVQGPQGLVQTRCSSCHEPDARGVGFQPVTMARHCQGCHELRFELAAPERQLPHGSVEEVMNTLRDFYSYLALSDTNLTPPPAAAGAALPRARPGQAAPAPQRLADRAAVTAQVQRTATEIFEKTTCFTCHAVTRHEDASGTATWTVAPVTPAPAWMPGARFLHGKHDMAACGSCHGAPRSARASDVLMPGIATCRACHAGAHPEPQKIVSQCGMCHGFHQRPAHPAPSVGPAPAWPASRDAARLQADRLLAPAAAP